jgi:hypothetical protein
MKTLLQTLLLAVLFCSVASSTIKADTPPDDHLVPVRAFFAEAQGVGGAYRKLWQEKLLVTPGELARYVYLPAPGNTEQAVSVYQRTTGTPSSPARYWVTVTEASGALWDCIPSGSEKMTGRKVVDPNSISIQRCDAQLPESTALAVHKVWLKVLLDVQQQSSDAMSLDGSTEIFSATNQDGKELQGQIPVEPKQNMTALLDLANLLADYCHVESTKQPEAAAKIEKGASDLLGRVSREGIGKSE